MLNTHKIALDTSTTPPAKADILSLENLPAELLLEVIIQGIWTDMCANRRFFSDIKGSWSSITFKACSIVSKRWQNIATQAAMLCANQLGARGYIFLSNLYKDNLGSLLDTFGHQLQVYSMRYWQDDLKDFSRISKYFPNIRSACLTDLYLSIDQKSLALFGEIDFKTLRNIQSLDLRECHEATDAAIAMLWHLTNLQTLKLGLSDHITNKGFCGIANLTHLHRLCVVYYNKLSDTAVESIWRLTNLQKLTLGIKPSDKCFEGITQLSSLQKLRLLFDPLSLSQLAHIGKLEKLLTLEVRGCIYTPDHSALLAKITNLCSLKLNNEGQLPGVWGALSNLTNLIELNLSHYRTLSNDVWSVIYAFTKLKKLNLSSYNPHKTIVTANSMRNICKLTNLEWLDLSGCEHYNEKVVPNIRHLTKLQFLGLDNYGEFNDNKISNLLVLTNLRQLHIGDSYESDREWVGISKLSQLRSLTLEASDKLTLTGLREIVKLTNLIRLALDDCENFTRYDLEPLKSLTQLTYLDAGVGPSLYERTLISLRRIANYISELQRLCP
jgi:hypothetical protein